MPGKNAVGRPPKYRSVKQLEEKIEQYFEDCKGHMLMDEETGKPVIYKGFPVYVDARPPTVTGLALALGFATRLSLLQYQGKPQFEGAILKAKSRIEQYNEERLLDRDGCAGARFTLQNNFRGWKTEAEVRVAGADAEAEDALSEIRRRMRAEETPEAAAKPSIGLKTEAQP